MKHLWLHNGVYPDWIAEDVFTLRLCEMYGCLPSALEGEDYDTVMTHRAIKAAEQRYLEEDARARSKRSGTK